MKKYLSLSLVFVMIVSLLCGCGGKKYDRKNYTKGLKGNVEAADLSNIVIDKSSEKFEEVMKNIESSDLESAPRYSGTAESGDKINIDYVGKVDGVAFTGGTASDYEYTLGSKQFIEDLDTGMQGMTVGETKDIPVTFPEGYGASTDMETGTNTIELSGAKAVFTVTLNFIVGGYDEVSEEFAKGTGYSGLDEYLAAAEKQAIEQYLFTYVCENSKVNSLPDDKYGNSYSYYENYYTSMATSNGYKSLSELLSASGKGVDEFKKDVLTSELCMYAAFDELELTLEEDAISKKADEYGLSYSVTGDEIISHYGENYLEYICVWEKVIETLKDKATIQ